MAAPSCYIAGSGVIMRLYVYADESGAFDKFHNDVFVYGGVVLLGTAAKDNAVRRFLAIEREIIFASADHDPKAELKASQMTLKERKRSFTSIERPGCHQYAAIVDQQALYDAIFDSKRRKQQFLDYALKRAVKSGIVEALRLAGVAKEEVDSVTVVVDEHSTSTDGRYNLQETTDEELRRGMFNFNYRKFFPPVFAHEIPKVKVAYVDSSKVPLIRAADVTANWAYMAERDRASYPHAYEMLKSRATIIRLP